MNKRLLFGLTIFLAGCFVLPPAALADDARVLPKGTFRAGIQGKFYLTTDEQFDDDGDTEDVAEDYNQSLDGSVFPALSLVENGFGMPPGSANIGDSVVSFDYGFQLYEFTFYYGLTDKISIGVKAPYWHVTNDVSAEVDPTNATAGFNPRFGSPGDPFKSPVIPTAAGGVPLTTDAVQQLLGDGLPGVPGYGYEPIDDWSGSGFADIEAGLRGQYHKTDDWRLALTGGVRFPTGKVDDPDILQDYPLGIGAYALFLYSNNDYTGIENALFNATAKYYAVLPDKEVKRVPDDVDSPITANKEEVDRNLGDVFELELQGTYYFKNGWSTYLFYRFGYKWEDSVSGDLGFAYESLEDETDYEEHIYKVGLAYSTLPLYSEKKFPVPLTAFIEYRDRFAGRNVLNSSYISLGLYVYF